MQTSLTESNHRADLEVRRVSSHGECGGEIDILPLSTEEEGRGMQRKGYQVSRERGGNEMEV